MKTDHTFEAMKVAQQQLRESGMTQEQAKRQAQEMREAGNSYSADYLLALASGLPKG